MLFHYLVEVFNILMQSVSDIIDTTVEMSPMLIESLIEFSCLMAVAIILHRRLTTIFYMSVKRSYHGTSFYPYDVKLEGLEKRNKLITFLDIAGFSVYPDADERSDTSKSTPPFKIHDKMRIGGIVVRMIPAHIVYFSYWALMYQGVHRKWLILAYFSGMLISSLLHLRAAKLMRIKMSYNKMIPVINLDLWQILGIFSFGLLNAHSGYYSVKEGLGALIASTVLVTVVLLI